MTSLLFPSSNRYVLYSPLDFYDRDKSGSDRSNQAGVFLPQQFRVFHKGGQLFRELAVRTQHGKPSCAIVFGSSTAGGAYHPALSDYTIFVENQAQAFLGGPPLVKMATGETIGAEELGGARIHATVTGLADQIASDEYVSSLAIFGWSRSLPTGL